MKRSRILTALLMFSLMVKDISAYTLIAEEGDLTPEEPVEVVIQETPGHRIFANTAAFFEFVTLSVIHRLL